MDLVAVDCCLLSHGLPSLVRHIDLKLHPSVYPFFFYVRVVFVLVIYLYF